MSTTSSNKENFNGSGEKSGGTVEGKSRDATDEDLMFDRTVPLPTSDSSDESEREEEEAGSSDSDDFMEPVVTAKRRKLRIGQSDPSIASSNFSAETLPVSSGSSEEESDDDDDKSSSASPRKGGQSPETPEGQWEIEEILNYVKDDYGEMYFVKWKDWASDFNTWEPPSNLLNCEDEMMRFYRTRKEQLKKALDESEYIELPNGKRRRKGPSLPDVPPDPRPFDAKVQDFLEMPGCSLNNDKIIKVFIDWKHKRVNSKSRWPISKVNKYLEDGLDGKLSKSDKEALKEELIIIEVEKRNQDLQREIKNWENKINAITEGRPLITIENNVDLSGPPIGFEFVNDYIAGEDVEIPTDPPVGCRCKTNCFDSRSTCCAMQFDYKFAYTRFRKVNVLQGSPIYECNKKCKCGPDCPNRVVQDGKSDHKLGIFRTSNGCGWGVKTLKSIKKGSFVTLYVGEVIKSEEAERRGKEYDETGCTYLFDLDFNDPDNYPYSVDASKYGNVAHFINHSCSPNLGVYAVWIDCLDPNLPKLAMFALRDISKNEELTFDYNVQLNSDQRSKTRKEGEEEGGPSTRQEEERDDRPLNKRTLCLCGTSKCRKYIF